MDGGLRDVPPGGFPGSEFSSVESFTFTISSGGMSQASSSKLTRLKRDEFRVTLWSPRDAVTIDPFFAIT